MAELIRAHDWSATPVGPIEHWPHSLKTAVGLVVASQVPMTLLWGPEGLLIYNEGYAEIGGARHPFILGRPVAECWPEAADFNDNVLKTVLAGKPLRYASQELTLYRNGMPEQVWMDLDYSPVRDDDGTIVGVIAIVIETTCRVQAERRLIAEHDLITQMFDQAPGFMAMIDGPDHLLTMTNTAYHRLIGRSDVTGKTIAEALPEAVEQGFCSYPRRRLRQRRALCRDRCAILRRRQDHRADRGSLCRFRVPADPRHDGQGHRHLPPGHRRQRTRRGRNRVAA
ncbi:PAS domain-containing protein [Sphingomonas aliaeris]|uniref:PAS domain-containing protein n=1 Tax=Sphingomonas aliaeris TaxID=2759526 RepID=UPI001CED1F6A|nr:PAS domain-containing protein [Sphingomonas aliaeris]